MDVVNVILQPVVESLMVPVKKHIVFMMSWKKYVRDMESKMKELSHKRVDVKNRMKQNKRNKLQIPTHVPDWLEEVKNVGAEVNRIPSNVDSCFSFKTRHDVGKKAFELIQDIKRLIDEVSRIEWTDQRIILGEVDSMKASASSPSIEYHSDFESREQTFMKALKALETNQKTHHMIALCGMGGVGKTTMMEKLKTVVKEKRMFSLVVEASIGEKPNPFAVQDAIADCLDKNLEKKTIPARAVELRDWFKNYSQGGKKKILVMLDDVWKSVNLSDIGLSPLPNQGVDFKVLLTSRDRDVCRGMGVEANSILNVNVLGKAEAQNFFWRFLKDSDEADLDRDLHKVGDDIVSRCHGLPILIKTIACNLKGKSKGVWEDTLTRLQRHDVGEIANEVFELSYNNLTDEQKSVLLLCGLYPEDFEIPTDELVRYGWGLKLFNKVYTLREARNRLNTCVEKLVNANLLIESNRVGSVKMHDLVLAFVMIMYSKSEHASLINHGNMLEWPANDTPDFYKRISLACNSMEEFPRDFKYPNLSFLKLTNGDKSLRFPENFYGLMENLQVIVYEKMQYPLLPKSFYSTNLRTLCLHGCPLRIDCHSIGGLLNLEVLSFANCSIQTLPSTVGNLKELKLLDLTGCVDLRIDEGVFRKLVKLEELYMRVSREKAISFTDGNFNELVERSDNLSALEIEFFRNNADPKRMSFKKLERFKICIGRFFEEKDEKTTFENTLMLVSNKGELLESRINVLFEKTVVLHLELDDMNDLSELKCSSFHNLRVLNIAKCAQLRYLFTCHVASSFSRLEHLVVSSCKTLKTLIHDKDNESCQIKFPRLKFLSLGKLPKFAGLCNSRNVIELPQLMELRLDCLPNFTSIFPDDSLASSSMSGDPSKLKPFLNEDVAIPKLETLGIRRMNKLKNIWSSEVTRTENVSFSMLKTIEVKQCYWLVNMFPRNPMPLLHHLKQLSVERCPSIETIFNIDMGCVPETKEGNNSSLVSVFVGDSENLKHVWSLKNVDSSNNRTFRGFEAVESIAIHHCESFRTLFTPITVDFNLEALQDIDIDCYDEIYSDCSEIDIDYYDEISSVESSSYQLSSVESNLEQQNIAFPSHLIHTFNQLRTLSLSYNKEAQVVFDIGSASSQNNHHQLLPSLDDLTLEGMDNMSYVWKCNWNRFFILQQPKSLCQNLTKITLDDCRSIKYLFSPLIFKFLSNLEYINIGYCEVMEEIVSNRYDKAEEMTTSTSTPTNFQNFPILENLKLENLESLQHIGGGDSRCSSIYNQFQPKEPAVAQWSLCQYSRCIEIDGCNALSSVIPSYALEHMQNLEQLRVFSCDSLKDVLEIKKVVNDVTRSCGGEGGVVSLTSTTTILPDFGNLRSLHICRCPLLRDVFPFSTIKSLTKLEELTIEMCDGIRVVVKEEEDGDRTTSSSDQVVVFPRLKCMSLNRLPNVKSFFLGMNEFQWPLLDEVHITDCPKMRMFTQGHSDTPMLKYLRSHIGEHSVECGLNNLFHHPTTTGASVQKEEEVPCPSLDGSSSLPISEKMPWFYNNLINVNIYFRWNQRFIIGHNELQHIHKIEKIKISECSGEREIFETFEMNSGLNQTHSVVEVREMDFSGLDKIKCLWKSKQWTVLKFPNLTRLSINGCKSLKHVFTISMVASLLQLQELRISYCPEMEIILVDVEEKDEDDKEDDKKDEEDKEQGRPKKRRRLNEVDGKVNKDDDLRRANEVEFPSLRLLTLCDLKSLKCVCLWMETIHWPSLDTLEIIRCPKITTFTNGQSTTPKIKLIKTSLGLCDAMEGVNSFIWKKIDEGFEF